MAVAKAELSPTILLVEASMLRDVDAMPRWTYRYVDCVSAANASVVSILALFARETRSNATSGRQLRWAEEDVQVDRRTFAASCAQFSSLTFQTLGVDRRRVQY